MRFNKDSRAHFLRFALAPDTPWAGNFRDLNAAITRMATLCPKGRITEAEVDQEIGRLQTQWNGLNAAESAPNTLNDFYTPEQLDDIDLFDQLQLAQIIPICQSSRSLADAGRKLFAVSRTERTSRNDSDRLRKYLAKFSLSFDELGG